MEISRLTRTLRPAAAGFPAHPRRDQTQQVQPGTGGRPARGLPSSPRSCTSRTRTAPLQSGLRTPPPPSASRFLLPAQRKRRHVGAGAAGRAEPGRHYRRFPVRGLGVVCPPPFSPPPPARPASRENQALFLARALPTVGTPAWQERPDAARQRLVPGPPSPHPARGGDTGDTAPDPRPPPGPGAACPQQPSKQGCPCPGEAPVTPPGLPTGRGAFRPTVAPRAAPRLRGRDPRAEGAGCGGSGRALRPA